MVKLQKLNAPADYCLPLLCLMDQLESAPMRDALAAFEEPFGELIPEEHHEKYKSGRVKWQHYVMWARFVMVRARLMGSGGHGIWTITPEGRNWLREHPEADASELASEIQWREKQKDTTAEGFRWQDRWYAVDRETLLSRARALLAQSPPAQALRYRTWAVLIDGKAVNVKWLFALATGTQDDQAFDSPTARRALSQIGIEVQRMGQRSSESPPTPFSRADRKARRQAFLEQIAKDIPRHLPDQARHGQVRTFEGKNNIQLMYPEFRGAQYELVLGRKDDRLAIHFWASSQKNDRRLRVFEPHQKTLSDQVGRPVIVEPWGQNWARVVIHLPSANWTSEKAQSYAQLFGRFVQATFPLLRQAFDTVPAGRRGRRTRRVDAGQSQQTGRSHAILEEQMGQIRQFLQGRLSRPSDEVLCDWVQFCYTFEMYREGHELFKLIVPSAANDWLYERARKLATVCRIRSR